MNASTTWAGSNPCNVDSTTAVIFGDMSGSYPGRIGVSPVIGADTYANRLCGVSNTGRGENVMKLLCAKQ